MLLKKTKKEKSLKNTLKRLENKVKNEKQFNRQVTLMGELRKAKKQLEVG